MKRIYWGEPGRADAGSAGPFLRGWQGTVGGAARAANLRARKAAPMHRGATLASAGRKAHGHKSAHPDVMKLELGGGYALPQPGSSGGVCATGSRDRVQYVLHGFPAIRHVSNLLERER